MSSLSLFLGRDMLIVHGLFLDLLGVDASTVETDLGELQGSSLIVGRVGSYVIGNTLFFIVKCYQSIETVYTQISFI